MIHKRDERFISALSGLVALVTAARVTGAEQRLVGGTHGLVQIAASQ